MQEVYVVVDQMDGTLVGVASTEKGAKQLVVKYVLDNYTDCDMLDISVKEYGFCETCYQVDYASFTVTKTDLIE